jgi:uncharacterized alkaline shock family protein YloU
MGHTRCWASRGIAIVSLTGVTLMLAFAAFVAIRSSWQAHAGIGRLGYVTQLEAESASWLNRLLLEHGVAVAALLAASLSLSVALLAAELRGLITPPRLIISRGALGEVAIAVDQVGKLAQREAEHVSGVREVKTAAHSRRAGIAVRQQIAVEPQVVFAMVAAQVQERVKQSLEHHLGLPVHSVQVALHPTGMRKTVL